MKSVFKKFCVAYVTPCILLTLALIPLRGHAEPPEFTIAKANATIHPYLFKRTTGDLQYRYLPPEGRQFLSVDLTLKKANDVRGTFKFDNQNTRLLADEKPMQFYGSNKAIGDDLDDSYPQVWRKSEGESIILYFVIPETAKIFEIEIAGAKAALEPRVASQEAGTSNPKTLPALSVLSTKLLETPITEHHPSRFDTPERTVEIATPGMRLLAVELEIQPKAPATDGEVLRMLSNQFELRDSSGTSFPCAATEFAKYIETNTSIMDSKFEKGEWRPVRATLCFVVPLTSGEFNLVYEDGAEVPVKLP